MWFVSERSFSYHVVELAIAEMACVSRNVCRTFHVPSGVPVQRSISGRDVSHPVVGIKFFALIVPCYDVSIAKAMDYTSKGELL